MAYSPFEVSLDHNELSVFAYGVTGEIRLSGIDIPIVPKYVSPEERGLWSSALLQMLELGQTTSYFPVGYVLGQSGQLDFLDLIGHGYADSLNVALSRGIPKAYLEMNEDSPFLRGRIDPSRLYPRIISKPHLLSCRISSLSEDIPLTRLLKWACLFLAERVRGRSLSQRLLELSGRFEKASSIPPTSLALDRLRLSGPHLQFERALTFGRWLAKGRGQQFFEGSVDVPGLVLKSEKVFQDFVSGCLTLLCRREPSWTHGAQQIFQLAIESGSDRTIATRPDDCLYVDGQLELVIDSKYKGDYMETQLKPNSSDVYQALAAARAANVEKSLLVYPARPSQQLRAFDVKGSGNPKTIFMLGLDPLSLAVRDGRTIMLDSIRTNINTLIAS